MEEDTSEEETRPKRSWRDAWDKEMDENALPGTSSIPDEEVVASASSSGGKKKQKKAKKHQLNSVLFLSYFLLFVTLYLCSLLFYFKQHLSIN